MATLPAREGDGGDKTWDGPSYYNYDTERDERDSAESGRQTGWAGSHTRLSVHVREHDDGGQK